MFRPVIDQQALNTEQTTLLLLLLSANAMGCTCQGALLSLCCTLVDADVGRGIRGMRRQVAAAVPMRL